MWCKITRFFGWFDTLWCDFKRGIKNLIIWAPAVWRDRQWDHQYIYMMLKAKLNFQEQYIRKHGIHVHNVRDADEIKVCIDALNRLIEDDYHSEAFQEHDDRWGKAEMDWLDAEDEGEGMVELKITYPKVKTEKDIDMEKNAFRLACTHEEYLRRKDMRTLFLNMYKNIQGWWD